MIDLRILEDLLVAFLLDQLRCRVQSEQIDHHFKKYVYGQVTWGTGQVESRKASERGIGVSFLWDEFTTSTSHFATASQHILSPLF